MPQSSTDYKIKVAWVDCLQGARRDHRILGLDRKARCCGNHRARLATVYAQRHYLATLSNAVQKG
jgi:hypothetical protein